ncbi:uncharacterized protein A4U43_C04F32850 [Asparagus officinalis]|uniref:Retroviral polymerase SH3-like domain-containing protein n=1 Tax=Asparagus officinalis TaxID=4686 RepID=A0A5P1F5A1_ASPOF|nr:uncharacterized protein A4U43_C04F32850 [Asparagus officinalis]
MNRTLIEHARSIRLHVGLPKIFWANAVHITAYLKNHGPSVPLDFRVLEEVWSDKKVNLLHLRVFGCVTYVHISDHVRDNLEAKSHKYTFIGYGLDEFGYRMWDDKNRKIVRSKNDIFNEEVMYKDMDNIKDSQSSRSSTKHVGGSEYMNLEELSNRRDNVSSDQRTEDTPGAEIGTQDDELRSSSRVPKPNPRYLSSLDYLLLTDSGEQECYEEAMQVSELEHVMQE